jgi:hypothetical protein
MIDLYLYSLKRWVDLRAGLDDVEKREFLILPGLELRPFDRPARSQTDCAIPTPFLPVCRIYSVSKAAP